MQCFIFHWPVAERFSTLVAIYFSGAMGSIACGPVYSSNRAAAVEAKATGLVDEEVEEAGGSSESTRQSSLSASIPANNSNSTAETSIAHLQEKLVQLFKRPKLPCKNITEEVASRITDAKHVGELSLLWNVMRHFRSNNIGPIRRRVLALGNAAEVATDLPQLTENMKRNAEGIPKKLRYMLESKEAQIQRGSNSSSHRTPPTPPPKRQCPAATSSRATDEELSRDSGRPLAEQGGVVKSEVLRRLAQAFGVDPDTVHKIRRRNDLFSLIDIAMVVCHSDQKVGGQQIRFVQNKYPEINDDIKHLQFPGRGQRETPACDISTLTRIVIRLPNADLQRCLRILVLLGKTVGASEDAIMRAANTPLQKRLVERPEIAAFRWLQQNGFVFTQQVQIGEGRRVDAVVEIGWHGRGVIEIDERQHRSYGLPEEVERTFLVQRWATDNPARGPTWLVRFNPCGSFFFGNRKVEVSAKTAEQTLLSVLRRIREEDEQQSFSPKAAVSRRIRICRHHHARVCAFSTSVRRS